MISPCLPASTPLHACGVDDGTGHRSQSCSRSGSLRPNATGSVLESSEGHPANGTPTDTAGMPPLWRSRSETDEASWGTAVGPPLYTTHWGQLEQPEN